jgi:hypothetical protein
MKNIATTAVLTVIITLAFLRIFFWPPCKCLGCLSHYDSSAICKAYIKNDRAKHPHKAPHRIMVKNKDNINDTVKHYIFEFPRVATEKDIETPGPPNTGDSFTITKNSQANQMKFRFNGRSTWTTDSKTPMLYSDTINQQTINAMLSAFDNEGYNDNDADYFYFDAATLFNFIYTANSNGTIVQDLVFQLARNPTNNNNLTLIISGLNNQGNLIPINGSASNALEDCYPCPECSLSQ